MGDGSWETGGRGDGGKGRRGDSETGGRGDSETGGRGDGGIGEFLIQNPKSQIQNTPYSPLPSISRSIEGILRTADLYQINARLCFIPNPVRAE